MSDDKLIAEMAELWVDNGGDAEGIVWLWPKLKDAVKNELERREWEEFKNWTPE